MQGFNPRTHTGCDEIIEAAKVATLWVSIHAPTRGATHRAKAEAGCNIVSIHAPTRGATIRVLLRCHSSVVSIHAPTRGATQSGGGSALVHAGFNPRTHTGCDGNTRFFIKFIGSFNPRTHTGCDELINNLFSHPYTFQSTHPHGVRLSRLG